LAWDDLGAFKCRSPFEVARRSVGQQAGDAGVAGGLGFFRQLKKAGGLVS